MGRGKKTVNIDVIEDFSKEKLNKIWDIIPIDDWAAVLRTNHIHHQYEIRGNVLKAQCVYHMGDSSPSMYLDVNRKLLKCFSASCNHFENNPIKIYAKFKKTTVVDALKILILNYNLKIFSKSSVEQLANIEDAFNTHELFYTLTTRTLINAYAEAGTSDLYNFAIPVLNYLESRRLDVLTGVVPIGIIPPEKLIPTILPELLDSEEAMSLIRFMYPIKDVKYIGQLVFPYRYSPSQVAYFSIRPVTNLMGQIADNKEIIKLRDGRLID